MIEWTWSELVTALKECQESLPSSENSLIITHRVFDCLVQKIALPRLSNHSTFQLPYTSRKSRSLRNSPRTWWFEDLVFLNSDFVEKLTNTMISRGLNHRLISQFLFYYLKSKCRRTETSEAVISLLSLLHKRSVSFKGLFDAYQAATRVRVSEIHMRALESLIGSQLDRVTLSYLLVPSPRGSDFAYNVDFVLDLVKWFLSSFDRCGLRLNKVRLLMDSYLPEVASDPQMTHSKFYKLVTALPDCATKSHDRLYQAIDMYFEVHGELHEEEKISLCCALNYEKLSTEALRHLAGNSRFPRVSVKAFMSQSSKLMSVIRKVYRFKEINFFYQEDGNVKFEADLQELLGWNEVELKKVCPSTTQTMAYTRTSGSGRYLPKLCGC